jgi:hypothetical protein
LAPAIVARTKPPRGPRDSPRQPERDGLPCFAADDRIELGDVQVDDLAGGDEAGTQPVANLGHELAHGLVPLAELAARNHRLAAQLLAVAGGRREHRAKILVDSPLASDRYDPILSSTARHQKAIRRAVGSRKACPLPGPPPSTGRVRGREPDRGVPDQTPNFPTNRN